MPATKRRRAPKASIAAALRASLSLEEKERSVAIAMRQLGFDGLGGVTLETIGREQGLTRERVRQIAKRTKERISGAAVPPVLDRALGLIEACLPENSATLARDLERAGLDADEFDVRGLVAANRYFQLQHDVCILPRYPGTILRARDTQYLERILTTARAACRHGEIASVGQISSDLQLAECGFSDAQIATLLDLEPGIRWLDDRSWFRIPAAWSRLKTAICKMLTVTSPLDVTLVRSGIARDHRLGVKPPSDVVVAYCALFPREFALSGSAVSTGPAFEAPAFNGTEQTFLAVLAANGGVCERDALERECLAAGMNPHTFSVFVGALPFIERIDKGVYALRGWRTSPARAEPERKRAPARARASALVDYGWSRGSWWMAYRLTREMIEQGGYAVAPLLADLLEGTFAFHDASQSVRAQLRNRRGAGSGLSRFLAADAQVGRHLVLAFDLRTRTGRAYFGGSELLAEFACPPSDGAR